MIKITIAEQVSCHDSIVLLATAESNFMNTGLTGEEIICVKAQLASRIQPVVLCNNGRWVFVQLVEMTGNTAREKETVRRTAFRLHQIIAEQKIRSLTIVDTVERSALACAFAEGLVLTSYQFLKYISAKAEKQPALAELKIVGTVSTKEMEHLNTVLDAVYKTRDMVNEPASVMTPSRLVAEIEAMGASAGFSVHTLGRTDIEKMKMGGILAVNAGSVEAPAMSILEWKPANAVNKHPVVLAGKGITYDTGGHNLKTGAYMDGMKCDMAGAATVAAVMHTIAVLKLPVYVTGVIPSTDNRLSATACSPGDIITMYGGTTVEVANTDAEGRLILADALTLAKSYHPALVMSIATLTGAAHRALGEQAMAMMGTASRDIMELLKACGESVHERMVEFPLWDEYAESLQSDVADLKNIGGDNAGMITAGKFLEHFTSYPFIHLDIAGLAFSKEAHSYRGRGATGFGVRLLFEFIKQLPYMDGFESLSA